MHLGIIPDGHRRYARNNNIDDRESYLLSTDRIDELVDYFNSIKQSDYIEVVDDVSVYAMSEQNLKRDDDELEVFYDALREYMTELLDFKEQYDKGDYNFRIISTNEDSLPNDLLDLAKTVASEYCGENNFNVLLSYDGKKEIAQAASNVSGEISRESIQKNLQVSDIDYVIRSGDNVTRECLSGFPIWQSSYSEYYHLEKNFPDVEISDFEEALEHYQKLRCKKGR